MSVPRKFTETFTANGSQSSFTVTKPIYFYPLFQVDGVGQTLLSETEDPGGQDAWYWRYMGRTIRHGQGTAPAAGTAIVVTYESAAFNNCIVRVAPASTTELAEVNTVDPTPVDPVDPIDTTWDYEEPGFSGTWESTYEAPSIYTADQADAVSAGVLRRVTHIPRTVKFSTDHPGWLPGQQCTFSWGVLDLVGTYIVMSVSAAPVNDSPMDLGNYSCLRRQVECALMESTLEQSPTDPNTGSSSYTVPPRHFTSFTPGSGVRRVGSNGVRTTVPKSRTEKYVAILGVGRSIAAGVSITNPYDALHTGTLRRVWVICGTAPENQALLIDIKVNGSTIFRTGQGPIVSATGRQEFTAFTQSNYRINVRDRITVDAVYAATGTDTAVSAQNVTIEMEWEY